MLRSLKRSVFVGLSFVVLLALDPAASFGAKGYDKLDEMAADRWPKLRETERYQLKIAEEYYRTGNYAVAAAEYEKFITLYESSEGASYVQLKWAHCQVHLKKLNTAVKDGYQTVIDYWPDSPDAVAAAYLIGETYKKMGELPQAKAAYLKLLDKHNGEMVAILARLDLADIARIEQDRNRQKALLKELVTTAPRTGTAGQRVVEASRALAILEWQDGSFAEGLATLGTSWKEPELAGQIVYLERQYGPLRTMAGLPETKERAEKVAGDASDYLLKQQIPAPKDDAEKARNWSLAVQAAEILSYAGRHVDAAKICEKALAQFGEEDQLLIRYAQCLNAQTRRDDARKAFGRMKNLFDGQYQIANSYHEERRYLEEVPIYQDLVTKDTARSTQWQYYLGEAYRHAGKYKEAIATFQQVDGTDAQRAAAMNRIAECYSAMNQFKEATGIYAQIIASYESEAPAAMWSLGHVHEAAGKPESAIKTFQEMCKRYHKKSAHYASLAHQRLNDKYKITVTLGGGKEE